MATYYTATYDYTDYGPARDKAGKVTRRYASRPECDGCGPFRGRYLRPAVEEHGIPVYICKGCDDE